MATGAIERHLVVAGGALGMPENRLGRALMISIAAPSGLNWTMRVPIRFPFCKCEASFIFVRIFRRAGRLGLMRFWGIRILLWGERQIPVAGLTGKGLHGWEWVSGHETYPVVQCLKGIFSRLRHILVMMCLGVSHLF